MDQDFLDLDREIRFYTPNFAGLEAVADDLVGTLIASSNPWHRMNEIEIRKILKVALNLYWCQTHNRLLAQKGLFVDLPLLDQFATLFRVPRFVRDAIREFCRPMEANAEIWLPKLSLPERGSQKLESIFGEALLARFNVAMSQLDLDLVFIEAENLKAQPLAFWSEKSDKLFCLQRLPEWRLAAMMRLRHCEHEAQAVESAPSTDEPLAAENVEPPSLLNSTINGRFVGSQAFFLFDGQRKILRYGFITGASRFPTDEEHSKTPPRKGKK